MKRNFRVIGIDDGSFIKGRNSKCITTGVLMRADFLIEQVSTRMIEVDGSDSTDRIIEIVSNDFLDNASLIMTYGVTFGGFNIADLFVVHERTGIPVISITRKRPDLESIFKAIAKTQSDSETKIGIARKYIPEELRLSNGSSVFVNRIGIDQKTATTFIRKMIRTGNIPEPIRLANMIAKSVKN